MPAGMCQNSSTFGFNLVYTTHSGVTTLFADMKIIYLALLGTLLLGYFY